MRFPSMWYVRPAKPQIRIRAFACCLSILRLLSYRCHLEFLSLKEGCRGSSESTLVKMSKCWKSYAVSQLLSDLHNVGMDHVT